MRTLIVMLFGALILPCTIMAQDDGDNSYIMLEDVYIKAKIGHEKAFEAAVKAHNEKYHADGPFEANLYYVATGNESGWYIWEMGPVTYTDLDNRPEAEGHDEDWDENIAPHVAEYGRSEFWRRSSDLSYSNDTENDKFVIWNIDLKRGEQYRFRAMMEKVKKIHEKMDDEISVWYTQFNQDDGRDVSIAWGFDKWGEFDMEDWSIGDEYDKEYGDGAWDDALEEWEEVVVSVKQEVWVTVD